MGRDQIKSASRHSFHDGASRRRTRDGEFEQLVRAILVQLGEDPGREGLRKHAGPGGGVAAVAHARLPAWPSRT